LDKHKFLWYLYRYKIIKQKTLPMDDSKNQLVSRLTEAKNVLVTVSRNPSIDQLAALMGLTLALNNQKKHAVGVFSGKVPSTLEFLQPEDTIQKTTDSLRDFIISLDKAKADKLRYKVEENVVKIFITPYKTSISQSDLAFSEGDFNVDVVIALGVQKQEDIDQAITAHGRILHDATVATINLESTAGLGSINWNDESASSLCELVTELLQAIDQSLIDGQIATSLLTGIVAETERFSNDKTSSHTMSASAALMSAGANQQLIATQLGKTSTSNDDRVAIQGADDKVGQDAGILEIEHTQEDQKILQNLSLCLSLSQQCRLKAQTRLRLN
jgi:nanoRNase/pAp phosphatase (c-di-AMP/oligoRNAs hydrolase)